MKLIAGTLTLFLGINLILAEPVLARFAMTQTRQVPISRLLRNLEYQRADAVNVTDKAMVDFRIGRLHAMAYARNLDQAPCDVNASPGSKSELPDFGNQPDHVQYGVEKENKNSPAAREHLKQALAHLQAAVKTDPSLATARLGLAWCLEQSGDKTKALVLYREVFNHAYEGEKNSKGGMYNWSISREAATYLKPLLDPVKDKQELEQVKSKEAQIDKLPRYVTPIMIPLASNLALNKLLADRKVRFDLDGFGSREYSKWLTPKAAWLVFDSDGKGVIDSGLKLVGQSSFWLFWKNGYEVLRGLDDNHDGVLSGHELQGLALWRDANSNGISEEGEVKSLESYGIVSLNVASERNATGILWNKKGVVLKNGSVLPSYDIILPTAPAPLQKGAESKLVPSALHTLP